jgi:hypothetical protein
MRFVHRDWFAAAAVVAVAFASAGCATHSRESKDAPKGSASSAASAALATPAKVERFGGVVPAAAPSEAIRDVLSAPERFQGRDVIVTGYVRRACSRRGCWMELSEGPEQNLPGCRVTFKDYGFFVPTDSAGARARVQAALSVSQVAPRMVEHLEQEGASFASKAADGSAHEVRLVATGVALFLCCVL